MDRDGKTFCKYAGLLDEAHGTGLHNIDTVPLQYPDESNGNTAVVRAVVTMRQPCPVSGEWLLKTYSGLGDASPKNVNRAMITCILRMAETRAKARALRDAINAAVCSVEELDAAGGGDDSDDPLFSGVREARERATAPPAPRPPSRPAAPAATPSGNNGAAGGTTADNITPAQRRMISALQEQCGDETAVDHFTRKQASQLIDTLKARIGGSRG